jgi:hypothetical protein
VIDKVTAGESLIKPCPKLPKIEAGQGLENDAAMHNI